MLLHTAFLPPASIFAPMLRVEKVLVDVSSRFVKQNIRTRCFILTANGVMRLVVPVTCKGRNLNPDSDIKISYSEPWQRTHLRSIEAAYGRSPFYIHYADQLRSVIAKKHDRLVDLNYELLMLVNSWLGIKTEIFMVEKPVAAPLATTILIDNKKLSDGSVPEQFKTGISYPQVFCDRFGFVDGLSILDLIMNLGPSALSYLKKLPVQ